MNILIIGGGLQGLSCACSLYEKHRVLVVGGGIQIKQSKFFDKVYDLSYSRVDKLIELQRNELIDVVLPVSDIMLMDISRNKDEIEYNTGCKVAVPLFDKLSLVEDKSRFMNFCETNDIPHPKTTIIPLVKEQATFPALIKPNLSVGARGITRVDSFEELNEKYPTVVDKYGPCTLQEYIENDEYYYNVMLYRNKSGNFLAHTIIKIVRKYPISAGSSCCCISVENDDLLQICKDCLNKLEWVGMADFDVLQRLDTGEYKIIEINARVPASLRAAAISNVNFPEIIVNDVMGLPVTQCDYQPEKILRYLGLDIMWWLKSPKRFKTNPHWTAFWGKNIYYQDIYREDPSTWWTWLAEGLGKIRKRDKKLR